MPKFEVLYLARTPEDSEDNPGECWRPLGEIRTTRTVDAIRELGGEAGVYRVREVAGDPRLWQMSADGSLQSINVP